jgi:hypothetical protein
MIRGEPAGQSSSREVDETIQPIVYFQCPRTNCADPMFIMGRHDPIRTHTRLG